MIQSFGPIPLHLQQEGRKTSKLLEAEGIFSLFLYDNSGREAARTSYSPSLQATSNVQSSRLWIHGSSYDRLYQLDVTIGSC